MNAPPPDLNAPPSPRRTSSTAIWAAVTGALGFIWCLPLIGGLLAITLGLLARGEIKDPHSNRDGAGLANLGIGLGIGHLGLFIVSMIVLTARLSEPDSSPPPVIATASPPVAPTAVVPAPPGVPSFRAPSSPSAASSIASVDDSVVEIQVGGIALVDLGGKARLSQELANQRQLAKKNGETLVLWTVQPACRPCNGVSAALGDPRMQTALAKVRLVRVDVSEHAIALRHLNIPVKTIPGFSIIGTTLTPVDYVHGGEWDEDVPRNIAPVMEKFIRGTYRTRRHPWSRADETPI